MVVDVAFVLTVQSCARRRVFGKAVFLNLLLHPQLRQNLGMIVLMLADVTRKVRILYAQLSLWFITMQHMHIWLPT